MILCSCLAVRAATIQQIVREGATTVGEIARITGAGTDCGSCACDIGKLLKREQQPRRQKPCGGVCEGTPSAK